VASATARAEIVPVPTATGALEKRLDDVRYLGRSEAHCHWQILSCQRALQVQSRLSCWGRHHILVYPGDMGNSLTPTFWPAKTWLTLILRRWYLPKRRRAELVLAFGVPLLGLLIYVVLLLLGRRLITSN
jgi:hypothetical protein